MVSPRAGEGEQALDHLGGLVHGLVLLPADFQLVVPAHHPDGQFLLNDANVLVEGAKDVNGILHPFNAYRLLDHGSPFSPLSRQTLLCAWRPFP